MSKNQLFENRFSPFLTETAVLVRKTETAVSG